MLDIKRFGAQLIETRDLDPVYVALVGAKLPEPQLCRWLSAYMMFYHVGVASWLSEYEAELFWLWCKVAARNDTLSPLNDRWPRSSERRHFRGSKCVEAVESMSRLEPEEWVRALKVCETEKEVMDCMKLWPMHGPWAGFKLADLLERCARYKIKFNENIGLMYDEPAAALEILAALPPSSNSKTVYTALLDWIAGYPAPPAEDRSCGPQELETVLCKWKSANNGCYFVGKDIREIRHALVGWGATAQKLLAAAPEEAQ